MIDTRTEAGNIIRNHSLYAMGAGLVPVFILDIVAVMVRLERYIKQRVCDISSALSAISWVPIQKKVDGAAFWWRWYRKCQLVALGGNRSYVTSTPSGRLTPNRPIPQSRPVAQIRMGKGAQNAHSALAPSFGLASYIIVVIELSQCTRSEEFVYSCRSY